MPQCHHVGAGFARLYAPTWMYSGRQTLPLQVNEKGVLRHILFPEKILLLS